MYNTAKYLPKCMDTLLNQDISSSDYEIILVDDCSTDNSLELAEEYVVRYSNVRICRHELNRGLAAARNTGIDAARGKYLSFVDPDDYIEKNSFDSLLKQMDSQQLDMLRFRYQKIDEYGNIVPDYESEVHFDYSSSVMTGTDFLATRLDIGCYVWAYIYRLDFLRQSGIRFFEGCFFDDTPWLPRVLQKAQRVGVTNTRHQYYLQRRGSMVHSHNIEAVLRKVNTQMQLIDILKEQKQSAPPETYEWYDMMLAHATISLLTSVAVHDYSLSIKYYKQLCLKGLQKLKYDRASNKSKTKIVMFNTFPKTLLFFIHIKNK